jgi:hypothetical protein
MLSARSFARKRCPDSLALKRLSVAGKALISSANSAAHSDIRCRKTRLRLLPCRSGYAQQRKGDSGDEKTLYHSGVSFVELFKP